MFSSGERFFLVITTRSERKVPLQLTKIESRKCVDTMCYRNRFREHHLRYRRRRRLCSLRWRLLLCQLRHRDSHKFPHFPLQSFPDHPFPTVQNPHCFVF
ncbi:hypothetical protein Hanom_Chr01g00029571 [Helianthus anomalus]